VRLAALVVLALAGLGAATVSSAHGEAGATEPLALVRAGKPADVLPARFWTPGLILTQTRLVAVTPSRKAKLYLVQTAKGDLCSVLVVASRAGGGGCRAPATFFGRSDAVAGISGRYFAGIASNRVAQVVIVDRHDARHPLRLSADHGFIVSCNGPDGCACAVAWVDSYDAAGMLIAHDRWLAPRCWLRPL
jgi:hypothetical protein